MFVSLKVVLIRWSVVLVPILAGTVVGGAGAWAFGREDGDVADKVVVDPHRSMSDDERSADVARIRSLNQTWLLDFIDSGRDPRSLPVADGQTFSAGAETIDAARSQAQTVIEATVLAVEYLPDAEGLTDSRATVFVNAIYKGEAAAQVDVWQVGGPARFGGDGVLQQLEGDPLLLPGDRVMLLLRSDDSGTNRTVYGVGVMRVDGGRVYPRYSDGPLATLFADLTIEEAVALLR